MPYLPDLSEGEQTRQVIDVFGGYNHNMRIGEGEWYNEENISSARFPLFSRRKARSLYKGALENPQGILAKDALAWVDGSKLYYNGQPVDGITLTEDGPKQLVSMGAYLCIFPDAVYFNTADQNDYGNMWADYTSEREDGVNPQVTYTPCRVDGTAYEGVNVSDTEPAEPTNGMYWLDTSGDTHALKQYNGTTGAWAQIPTVYTRIEVEGIGKLFKQYDGVTITGVTYTDAAPELPGEDASEEDQKNYEEQKREYDARKAQIEALNTDAILYGCGDDYIIVTALIDQITVQQAGSIRVERKVPKMNYVCEANNRLWGCYYGAHDGNVLNEIYSCKLGDFKNWNCFMGISTDSYRVSVGTDGEFTGCISYLGYPVFFKENCIHKVYGMQPSAYQVQTTSCRGVQRGSYRSLAVVDEILYYKSRSDVCAYDGSMPAGISMQLGDDVYKEACAGTHSGKYYISMKDADDAWHLFVYDTKRSLWHREDASHASAFTAWNDALYMLEADKKEIWDLNGTGDDKETGIGWMAESGLIGYELIDHKYISRFNFRMKLGEEAWCKLEIEYDSSGEWEDQGTINGAGTNSFVLPVIPRRCDHFRLRLSGEGEIWIYSMAKYLERGSDA